MRHANTKNEDYGSFEEAEVPERESVKLRSVNLGSEIRPHESEYFAHEDSRYAEQVTSTKSGGRRIGTIVYSPSIGIDDLLNADKIIIRRSWRSLPLHWLAMFLLALGCIELSAIFPWSIINAELDLADYVMELRFPVFIFPLILVILDGLHRIHNRFIEVEPDEITYVRGNLTMLREVAEMEPGRMQVVTVKQKPWEVLLGVGNVSLGTFTRRSMEFDMYGVAAPQRLARLLKIFVYRARSRETHGEAKVEEKELEWLKQH